MPHPDCRPVPAAAPAPACIHELFQCQAAATPERVAVVHQGQAVTYAELNARANHLAHRLRAAGVGAEVPVAVFLSRTPGLPAALLGVLKAGGAYVPLDPAYPPDRVAMMLADSRAPVVVTERALAGRLPPHPGATVLADDGPAGAATDPAPAAAPGNLAYVIYTSGSTGRPKGVMVEHRQASAFLHQLRDTFSDDERTRALAATSVCFDFSVAEIFGTLGWGGTLVLVDDALALAGVNEPVRMAHLVPSAAAELVRQGAIPPTLRTLVVGGEPVSRALADALYARTEVERLLDAYGPTEDTVYSTCGPIPRNPSRPITIGTALAGRAVYVLDGQLRPVDGGAEGELFTAGAGVTRGYLGRPALTADRYLPDPFSATPGARMYRTGDLGRRRTDGEYECRGRIDRQVKIRGFRVEPGEVEAALAAHPGVAEAAVAASPDHSGEPRLVAWVAPAGLPGAELRAHLKQRLPDYMVPAAFVGLGALPRTPSGKIDYAALPAPEGIARPEAARDAPPRTPVEEILCGIWTEVLGRGRVGVHDDFMELGGHSLRAMQIVARVREALGAEIPLTAVFGAPTVAGLAEAVEAALGAGAQAEPAIPRAPRDRPLPLSPAQEAVWFFERLSPGIRSYQFQAAVRLRGTLDVEALRRALDEVVRRHEIFRTTFHEIGGAPVQVVHEPWRVELPVMDAAGLSPGALDERFAAEFGRPFDVGALPLARWTLFRAGDGEHVLLCVEHHMVHDGWSFGVFLRELTALYAAFARGEPSPLAEPALQFGDFAAWQRSWLLTEEARRSREYWKGALAGVPPVLELAGDRPRPPRLSFEGDSVHVSLSPELARAADAFGRAHGVTLYMTLLAAFQALLYRYTGQEAFCLGGGSAGRRLRAFEELIGMAVNVIPLRADLSADPDFLTLAGRVRRTALEAYLHQDLPLAEIVEAVQPERTLDRLPVFQHAFNMHHAPYPDLHLPELHVEVVEALGNRTAKFDLQVIVIPRAQQNAAAGSEVRLIWEFGTGLFDRATIERMSRHYQSLLAAVLAHPDRPASAAPMLDEAERAWLVQSLNRTPGSYPRDATLHGLFRDVVRGTPGAPAVEWNGQRMTYAELDAASDRVAAGLRALRLPPEARVGIALPRSAGLVAAIVGTLKAGCAYVPLDPEYPAARLAFMVADAEVRALVVADDVPAGLRDFAGPVLSMAALPSTGDAGPPAFATAESLACVLYTSGSTGTPKGIGVTHRGAVRLARGEGPGTIAAADRVAQTASASFDALTWELWGALLNGACLVGIERDDLLSPAALASRVREAGITAMFLTTPLFNQVARDTPGAFAGVRIVIFGGDAADAGAVRRVLRHGRPERLVNAYGPTENSTFSSWRVVQQLAPDAVSVPIGRPVAHSAVYVLDPGMRPVPAGVPGELFVAGDGVSRGYLGRPALTAERFVPDPFAPRPGARMYRTGDRGRYLADGALEYLGRMDAQLKVRGFRVEPGEVEAALHELAGVSAAVVAAHVDASGERSLVAYVVPAAGEVVDPATLRAGLAERLPPFMVPAAVVSLPALPLTPSGKVNRAALPAPESGTEAVQPVASGTEEERTVHAIWREVLGAPAAGATDSFWELGGHSLLAMRLTSRVREALGVDLPVSALFEAPTAREFAARVAEARARRGELEARLDWLESLSEEDARALLADRQADTG